MKDFSLKLKEVQDQIIGLYKIHGQVELVFEESKDSFKSIFIGSLLGLRTNHYSKSEFYFKKFPKKKTLTQMMEAPLDFQDWYIKNKFNEN